LNEGEQHHGERENLPVRHLKDLLAGQCLRYPQKVDAHRGDATRPSGKMERTVQAGDEFRNGFPDGFLLYPGFLRIRKFPLRISPRRIRLDRMIRPGPHGDGSGRDSEAPTGDDYNVALDALEELAEMPAITLHYLSYIRHRLPFATMPSLGARVSQLPVQISGSTSSLWLSLPLSSAPNRPRDSWNATRWI
jgi:hypothetical protein